ncbi:MAG TPA: hypothetical protein PKB15_01130 [Acidimicrobiia bacterium]|nr:hypothetical protein [Acidimicrobiia bacterium]
MASKIALLGVVLCVVLSGCKATSRLTIELGEKTSGTITFSLVLDEQAASAVRRDVYEKTTLSAIFDTKKLKKAGFKVAVKDGEGAPGRIDITASFSNEKQLQAALAVLAPPDVINASLISKTSFIKEKQQASIAIDVSRLRDLYLKDDAVKAAVEESGMEFSEFETLITTAMTSTKLTVVLKRSGQHDTASVTGDTTKKEIVAVSHDGLRTRYLANMAGAIVCALIGLVLLWKLCRTPRLLSPGEQTAEPGGGPHHGKD